MNDLPDILNWRRYTDAITTSGQPTEQQLADINALGVTHIINLGPHENKGALEDEAGSVAALGVTHIINLGPHENKGALEDEAGSVAALGMEYVYIPVDFENPTDDDFVKFCEAMEMLADRQVHVHCIYNARVSAFFYRYAKSGRGVSEADAFAVMDGIWQPGNDWAEFIGDPNAEGQPNRYTGYDD